MSDETLQVIHNILDYYALTGICFFFFFEFFANSILRFFQDTARRIGAKDAAYQLSILIAEHAKPISIVDLISTWIKNLLHIVAIWPLMGILLILSLLVRILL